VARTLTRSWGCSRSVAAGGCACRRQGSSGWARVLCRACHAALPRVFVLLPVCPLGRACVCCVVWAAGEQTRSSASLSLYSDLSLQQANDNCSKDSTSGASCVTVKVRANTQVYIAVDGVSGATGAVTLNLKLMPQK
jgi:hypothetical protein